MHTLAILPFLNQKQVSLSLLHNHMLLNSYVSVLSLLGQLVPEEPGIYSRSLPICTFVPGNPRQLTCFRSDAGTWRWRSVFGGYKLLRWLGISLMGELASELI